ncbi:MAG TPA: PPC domain-containing DNA-binding protein [Verrucomicrobiae bacterium]|jgi:hypothetical protein
MKSKLLSHEPETYALVFETGDEVMTGLKEFAQRARLAASHFTAIGAFANVVLGYFKVETRDYKRIPVQEQVEVLSLIGDVTRDGAEAKIHAHVVLGKSDGTTAGGHLIEGHVRPTLELILTELPAHLHRKPDAASGLALIDLEKTESKRA